MPINEKFRTSEVSRMWAIPYFTSVQLLKSINYVTTCLFL